MENVIKINQMSTEISGSLSIEFMGVGLGSCLVLLYIPVKVDHHCVIALAVRLSSCRRMERNLDWNTRKI